MNTAQRIALFLLVCIPFRLFLVYVVAHKQHLVRRYAIIIAILAATVGIGFMYLYANNDKTKRGQFGGKVWWNSIRPIHGFLYLYFAYLVIQNDGDHPTWVPLFIDVLLGLTSFLVYYSEIGNPTELIS